MSYGYGYYGYGSSSSKKKDKDKKRKKKDRKVYLYFIAGLIVYPLVIHFFQPSGTITFGKSLVRVVFLGLSALVGSIISHRLFGIVEKYNTASEFGKFFLVFMAVYSIVAGWGMVNLKTINQLELILLSYLVATFVGIYTVSPKKTPKSKVAVTTLVVGYIIYAGLVSILHI